MKPHYGRGRLVGIKKPQWRVIAVILSRSRSKKQKREKHSLSKAEAAIPAREGNISSSSILQSSPTGEAAATEAVEGQSFKEATPFRSISMREVINRMRS